MFGYVHSLRKVMEQLCNRQEGLALCTGACNNVRRLDLSWNDLRFKGISSICSALERPHLLEHLQVVTLRGNNIDDTCLRRIGKSRSLSSARRVLFICDAS